MSPFARDAMKPLALAAGAAAVAGLAYLFFGDAIKRALSQAGNLVNPASDRNVVYRTVNAAGQALSGRESFSFGSWLYDVLHDDTPEHAERARQYLDEQAARANRTQPIGGG